MGRRVIALACVSFLSACSQTTVESVWCNTHTKEEFLKTPEQRSAQTPGERRSDLDNLEYGSAVCGWRP